jgi:hypothetical protein
MTRLYVFARFCRIVGEFGAVLWRPAGGVCAAVVLSLGVQSCTRRVDGCYVKSSG